MEQLGSGSTSAQVASGSHDDIDARSDLANSTCTCDDGTDVRQYARMEVSGFYLNARVP